MNLIEKTNSSNIQVYLSSKDSEFSCIELIKNNLFQRLLRYLVVSGIAKEEFSNKMSENLRLKIIKVSEKEKEGETPNLYVGNINLPTIDKSEPLKSNHLEVFKKSGIELPREKLLSSRLEELNYSSEDPFRLENINFSLLVDDSFEEIEFSDIQKGYHSFKDSLYSFNKTSIKDKLKATYILSLNKVLSTGVKPADIPDNKLSEIVNEIDDKELRKEIFLDLKKFLSDPYSRPRMIENSERVLNSSTKGEESSPIKTWKVVTACVILILGILAYTKKDSIKAAYQIARESKDLEISKFRLFTRTLFTGYGRKAARDYVNNTKVYKEESSFLDNLDSTILQSKSRILRSSKGIKDAINRLNGKR